MIVIGVLRFLAVIAVTLATLLAAPFVAAMRLVDAFLGLTAPLTIIPVEGYMLLHALLGGFVGLLVHRIVRRRHSGGD